MNHLDFVIFIDDYSLYNGSMMPPSNRENLDLTC